MEGYNEINQYLTFEIADEIYGVTVSKVKEVLELIDITRVPKMPEFMRGVINLRGNVVPVIDMGLKFGMDEIKKSVDTCIVVLEIEIEGDQVTLGALVDAVQEVLEIDQQDIEPAPKIGTSLDTEFIKGMGKKDNDLIIILDIDNIFTRQDLTAVAAGQQLGELGAGKEAKAADNAGEETAENSDTDNKEAEAGRLKKQKKE